MHGLPFLVVYGSVVGKLIVVAIAGLLLRRVWVNRRQLDAEHARWALSSSLARAAPPTSGDGRTLRGVLHETAGQRWLDCDGERIELDGDLRIERGARVTQQRGQPTHCVGDGDDVLVTGLLTSRLGHEDAASSYRSAATGWTMAPSSGRDAIDVVAAQPASAARRPGWRAVVVCGLVVYGAMYGLGRVVLSIIDERPVYDSKARAREISDVFRPFAATSIGAALPGARDAALRKLDSQSAELPRRPEVVEIRIALAHLLGCHEEARRLLANDRFERALDVAVDCGDKLIAVQSLLQLGRYEDAAQQLPLDDGTADRADGYKSIDLTGIALIGAGRWNEAAAAADDRAAWRAQNWEPPSAFGPGA